MARKRHRDRNKRNHRQNRANARKRNKRPSRKRPSAHKRRNPQRRSGTQKRTNTKERKNTSPKAQSHKDEIVIPPYAREELEARWERAGIENDYIFAVVMQNADIYLQLMQRILPEYQLTRVTRHEQQKALFGAPDAKSVRYDVYSEINGIHFVVEMQMRSSPSLRRRTRYYQSLLDIQNLRRGADYRNLPDSFVIMFCPFDLFGLGRHLYRFRYLDINDRSLELGDGADKIFINTRGTADDISQDLRNVLDLINGKAPADSYCQQVADRVYEAKHTREVKRMFMNVNLKQLDEIYEARQEAAAEGRAQGRAEEQQNSLRMLCDLVAEGDLSIRAAVKSASAYGVTDEADLRRRAQLLGIKL